MKFRCRSIIGDYFSADLRRTLEIGDHPKPGPRSGRVFWAQRKKGKAAPSARRIAAGGPQGEAARA